MFLNNSISFLVVTISFKLMLVLLYFAYFILIAFESGYIFVHEIIVCLKKDMNDYCMM